MANYKIIGFDKQTGVLTVSYDDSMAPVGIDVPIDENGLYITGESLDTYIQGFIPTWHLERVNQIASGIANEAQIESLVEVTADQTSIQEGAISQAQLDQNNKLENEIVRILIKHGVLTAASNSEGLA